MANSVTLGQKKLEKGRWYSHFTDVLARYGKQLRQTDLGIIAQ
jgi:hypothetical protein